MKKLLLICSVLFCVNAFAQQTTLDFHGGVMNYQGDLQSKKYTFQLAKPAFGIGFTRQLGTQLSVRGGIMFGQIQGNDMYQKDPALRLRNLSFYSNIAEVHAGLQYMLMDISTKKYSPYVFAGLGVFKFDPYIYDRNDNRVYLRPLRTEGQGLSAYPNRKVYKTTQLAIPLGVGYKYAINESLDIGIELNARKLFTDYLDDVSTSYADYFTLKNNVSEQAVILAFRTDELQPASYPAGGTKRGSPRYKDWYYTTTFTISYKFGGEPFSAGSGNGGVGKKYRKGTGCPKARY